MSTPLTSARVNSNIAEPFLTQKEHIRRWACMEAHRPYAVLERSHYLRDLYKSLGNALKQKERHGE